MIETETIIIGSGPAGVNAAWPLVLAGRSVFMIDAGNGSMPKSPKTSIELLRDDPNRWKHYFGKDLGGLFLQGDFSPKLSTPLGRAVLEAGNNTLPKLNINNFMAIRSSNPGGLSAIWGGFCSAYDAKDMANYPISRTELEFAYRTVAQRIGISGADDDLADFHGEKFPLHRHLPLTQPAAKLFQNYDASVRSKGFRLGLARNAVITEDINERESCNQCGLCLLGCARRSIYNSADELAALKQYANFSYISGTSVKRLISLGGEQQIIGLSGNTTIKAKYLLLGAGTVNSTAMILEYADMFGTKLRVLSNPVAGMAFVLPKLIGNRFYSNSFSLGQLSYRLDLPHNDEYATGVIYGADTLPLDVFARRMPFSRPVAMRLSALLAPALLPTTAYLPGKYSSNTLSLEKIEGNTEIILDGLVTEEAKKLLEGVGKKLGKIMRRFGAYLVPSSLTISPPGSDAHVVGTIPMGGQGRLSCSATCELNIAKGVYVIDGSWFPELPAKHCTFTIMANAYRVGTILAEKLRYK